MTERAIGLSDHNDDVDQLRSPTRAKLAAASLIDPIYHGEQCPGLSGLYSIVNGIRLALAPDYHFDDRELAGLVAAGLRFFNGRLTPEQVMMCGLPFGLWLRLAECGSGDSWPGSSVPSSAHLPALSCARGCRWQLGKICRLRCLKIWSPSAARFSSFRDWRDKKC